MNFVVRESTDYFTKFDTREVNDVTNDLRSYLNGKCEFSI